VADPPPRYWHENADMNPPPPGAAGLPMLPLVRIMMVPAETLADAVPDIDDPAAAAVENESMLVPKVHVTEVVDGVIVANTQVVVAFEYDQTVREGLQDVGAITEGMAFGVDC
jgi:hypothetical protein